MKHDVSDILKDLYDLEPGFRMHEKQLKTVIGDLIDHKPKAHLDEQFVARLRKDLVHGKSKISILSPYLSSTLSSITSTSKSATKYAKKYTGVVFGSQLYTSIASALLAIILVAPLTYFIARQGTESPTDGIVKDTTTGLSLKQQISSKGTNAFGTLAYIAPAAQDTAASASIRSSAPQAFAVQSNAKVSAPTKTNAEYTYTGDSLTLTSKQGKVFKRLQGGDAANQLSDFLKNAHFNLVNPKSFSKLSVENIQLAEGTSSGYSLGINLKQGIITITANTSGTATNTKTKTPVLDDVALITITDGFIKNHDIDVSTYGKPVVESAESHTVLYPLVLDGKQVFDESGALYGMHVHVDPHAKTVSMIDNLTSQVYESSLYDLETDSAKVLAVATSSNGKKSKNTVNLTTPEHVLMLYTSGGTELYVPALLFPVSVKKGEAPKHVIIPLVKDALDKIKVESAKDVAEVEPVEQISTSTIPTPTIVPTTTPSLPINPAVVAARNVLAEKLNIPADQVVLVSTEPVLWPNSCLGVSKEGELCDEVRTSGYDVKFKVNGLIYEFHTDKDGTAIRQVIT